MTKTFNIVHLKKVHAYILPRLDELQSLPSDLAVMTTGDVGGRSETIEVSLPNITLKVDGESVRCIGLAHHIPQELALGVVKGLAETLKLDPDLGLPAEPSDPTPDVLRKLMVDANTLLARTHALQFSIPQDAPRVDAARGILLGATEQIMAVRRQLVNYCLAAWDHWLDPDGHDDTPDGKPAFRRFRELSQDLMLFGHSLRSFKGITLAGCSARATRGLLTAAAQAAN